ncbi:unnamed protein product, partial [Rotaria sp. Silwood1]
MNTSETIRRII